MTEHELDRIKLSIDRDVIAMMCEAVLTLERLGYTYMGGGVWQPPDGDTLPETEIIIDFTKIYADIREDE